MANGGGKFQYFNKKINGVYDRTVTQGAIQTQETNGIVAGAFNYDWAPDNKIFTITKEDFISNPEALTGYTYSDPKNLGLREVFCYANELITYRLNSGGSAAKVANVGQAKYSGSVGNKITVSVLKNVLDTEKYDVSTYFNGVEKDKQTVSKAGIDEIKLTKGTEKPGTTVESADASFTFADNQITVQFSSVPEGYKPSVRIKGQVGILAFTPGRMEDTELQSGNKHIISYYPGAAINGEMTVEAVLTKDKVTVLKSCTYTCQLNEDVQVGADGSKLEDNDYVIFSDGVILENAGYAFTGGSTRSSATASNHNDFLNKLEGKTFNTLFYDGKDEQVKALYDQYTKRLRDERGIYFQSVMEQYSDSDYEGVISIYNEIISPEQVNTATPWLAGLESALDLNQEATNVRYNGELQINADITQSRMEVLIDSGHFFFHEDNDGEVYTYEDVNTFRSFTEDKNDEIKENKVIRIVDNIYNYISRICNRRDIGHLNNTPEGRNVLWSRIDTKLTELVRLGAIEAYEPTDIQVLEIPNQKDSVRVELSITVNGTIRKIYITTYIVR